SRCGNTASNFAASTCRMASIEAIPHQDGRSWEATAYFSADPKRHWAMAGADTTDPVSPVRFGNQPDLIATEDAANPPFENLSTNTRFANEINRRTGVRR
ncbi:hypothetical protein AB1484_24295, partial [Parafrankia sp. FMc6]